ncbi:hypothetical protein J3R83DRAFT_5727 [Lanmaoa asiatica]|nr:hypothetical protein J3R83DRAFT_5727 [Lanmaoa asiatica]
MSVRYTTPGHANPYFLDRAHFIDPSHPAAKLALRNLPSFVCPQFTIRAFPNAILQEPIEFVPINPLLVTGLVRARTKTHVAKGRHKWWSKLDVDDTQRSTQPDTGTNGNRATWATFHEKKGHRRWNNFDAMRRHVKFVAARQLADARVAALAETGRHNVSLLFHTSKKATSKLCVIRRRLRSKMTSAIGLVVGRNADAVDAPENDQPASPLRPVSSRPVTPYPPLNLVSRPLQESERLILQDWTYLVIPDLSIYRIPLPNLVQAVRKALLSLSHQSIRLESSWSALPKSKARSPQTLPLDRRSPSIHSPLRRPRKVLTKSLSVIRTWTNHPHPRASGYAQSSDSPHESAKLETVSTRLYSSHPIILSHENPAVKK